MWRLGVAFFLVVLCFLASTAVTQTYASQIGTLSDSLANNAMPSIEHLAAARTEVHSMRPLASAYATANETERAHTLETLEAARGKVDRAVSAYLVLPRYPGEDEAWRAIETAKSAIDSSIDKARRGAGAHDDALIASGAAALETACDQASEAFLRDIELNAENGEVLGRTITLLRHRALTIEIGLDALSVLLTGVLAAFAVREVTRYNALLHRHNQVLAARAEELEQFAGRVAHDISGPISSGMLNFELARRFGSAEKDLVDATTRGLSSLKRAQLLLDALLEFARAGATPDPGARAQLDAVIPPLVAELRASASESDVQLICQPMPNCAVRSDPSILGVLVANLVGNAIKYIGDGAERKVTISAAEVGNMVRIVVEDTGPGIPRELIGVIFEPFVRGPNHGQKGVGLGLATVRRICERHGGHVGVESIVGHGTKFWIELPAAHD